MFQIPVAIIGVISDTHGLLRPEALEALRGSDYILHAGDVGDRTILNPSGKAGTGTSVYGLDRQGNTIAATAAAGTVNNVVAWVATNPNARYIQTGPGGLANTGRNTEATRAINNWDFTVVKKFQFKETRRFEISGQAYNLFNHAQFVPGSIGDVGRVSTSAATAYSSVTNLNFNNPETAFGSHPRMMQIVAKFIW